MFVIVNISKSHNCCDMLDFLLEPYVMWWGKQYKYVILLDGSHSASRGTPVRLLTKWKTTWNAINVIYVLSRLGMNGF